MFYSDFSIPFCCFSFIPFSVASWVFLGRKLANEPALTNCRSCEDWQISNDFPFLFYYTHFPFLCIFCYNRSCQLGADSKSSSIELFLFRCRGLSGKEDRPGFSSDTACELDTESETPIVYPYFLRIPPAFNSSKPNLLPV